MKKLIENSILQKMLKRKSFQTSVNILNRHIKRWVNQDEMIERIKGDIYHAPRCGEVHSRNDNADGGEYTNNIKMAFYMSSK